MQVQLAVSVDYGVVIAPGFGLGQFPFQPAQFEITIQDKIPGRACRGFDFLRHMGNPATAGQGYAALLRRQLSQ